MSLLFIDGFDHHSDSLIKWDASLNTIMHPIAGLGRFGGQALRLRGVAATLTKSIANSKEVILGAAYKLDPGAGISAALGTFTRDNDFQLNMQPDTGIVSLNYVGGTSGTITIASPTSTVTSGTWFYIEARVKTDAVNGEMELRVNNVVVASITGIDTIGADGGDIVSFHYLASGSSASTVVDDLYVLNALGSTNNTFLGDCRVSTHYPKGQGTNNNFASSTGGADQYTMVDETLYDGDTTFVESGIVGAKEDYNNQSFADLSIIPGTIFGVQTVNAVRKTDAAELRYRNQMVIGGTAYDTGVDTSAVSALYKMTTYIRDTDPSDNAAWTEAKVSAVGSAIEIKFRQE